MANVTVSEVLCFIANKFSVLTKLQLKSILVGFYTEEELIVAKDGLFASSAKLNVDGLPRPVKRARGDNRAKLTADDLLDLYMCLDEKGCLDRLPTYVARNLERVPSVKLEDMELYCVSQKLESLDKRLSAVESVNAKLDRVMVQLDTQQANITDVVEKVSSAATFKDACSQLDRVMVQLDTQQANITDVVEKVSSAATFKDACGQLDHHPTEAASALVVVDTDKADSGGWHTVHRKSDGARNSRRQAIRVRGTKVGITDDAVKAIPRKPVLAAFVSRLHRDTTDEELTTYLTREGMKGVVCRRLEPKDGQTFRTSAFYVSCCVESAELFYNEECWPAGVELRDWVYKR